MDAFVRYYKKGDTEGLQKYGLIFKEQGTGAGTGTITS